MGHQRHIALNVVVGKITVSCPYTFSTPPCLMQYEKSFKKSYQPGLNGNISLGLRKATADLVSSGGQRRGYCCTLLCTGLARHLKGNALSMTLKFTGQITKSQCHSVWRCKNQRNSSETWKLFGRFADGQCHCEAVQKSQ